ncbi:NUDIX domain-containing protein [Desulfotruncus alcoholivorax]|uniref:NUDIX domain-containing protein n=1 Tax=Desulfotruncus alcoholivorax TaxID=265477 RepID=UPI000422CDA2|nr:NUDIX hydrolase [Desulfotruncus alcoholivorax]
MEEKRISSENIYAGKIMTVKKDQVILPDGRQGAREIVELSDAVAVLAINNNNEVLMVRQFRHPAGESLLEIPAGKVEKGEKPLDCAKRELEEETGCRAAVWKEICYFFTSPGFCTEKIYLYLAGGLSMHETKFDQDEFIEIETINVNEAMEMIKNGDIKDAKTIIGILFLNLPIYQIDQACNK